MHTNLKILKKINLKNQKSKFYKNIFQLQKQTNDID
jgi:hypothetical protein